MRVPASIAAPALCCSNKGLGRVYLCSLVCCHLPGPARTTACLLVAWERCNVVKACPARCLQPHRSCCSRAGLLHVHIRGRIGQPPGRVQLSERVAVNLCVLLEVCVCRGMRTLQLVRACARMTPLRVALVKAGWQPCAGFFW